MKKLIVITTFSTIFAIQVIRANTIADWTFETTAPITAGPFSPEVGSGSASGLHVGTATYSTPAGNGSAHSFSVNTWAVNDYFQFQVSTIGFQNISLSYDQNGSSTGPSTFQLAYSINGTTFINIGSTYVIPSGITWTSGTANALGNTSFADALGAITALNNASTVYFRLIDAATNSISGGTVGSGGTDRVDNFIVNGDAISAPDQTSTFVLMAMGVSACVVFQRKKTFSMDVSGRAEQ
jgi:hypothetical protein